MEQPQLLLALRNAENRNTRIFLSPLIEEKDLRPRFLAKGDYFSDHARLQRRRG
jgi:hypothetical protein